MCVCLTPHAESAAKQNADKAIRQKQREQFLILRGVHIFSTTKGRDWHTIKPDQETYSIGLHALPMVFLRTELIAAKMFIRFLPGLTIDAQARYRAGVETRNADLLATLLTNAIRPVVNTLQGSLNFADQTTLTVANSQGESPVRLGRGPVCRIGKHFIAVGQFLQCGIPFQLGFFQHLGKKFAEPFQLIMIHNPSDRTEHRVLLFKL
jgi:hypothetical protein